MAVLAAPYMPGTPSAYSIPSPLMTPPGRITSAMPATITGMVPYGGSDRFFSYSAGSNVSYPSAAPVVPLATQSNGVRRAVSSPSLAALGGPRGSYLATSAPSSETTVGYLPSPGGSLVGAIASHPSVMAVPYSAPRTSTIEAYSGRSPREFSDRYAIVTAEDSALGNTSALATLSVDSPSRRKKAARAQRLYEDAVARRQRHQEMKEEADKMERDTLEQGRTDAMLTLRARQRFYRLRDTRTHQEREEAILKKREDTRNTLLLERQRQEKEKYSECTFQPKIFTKKDDRDFMGRARRSTGVVRSSSCDAVFDRVPPRQEYYSAPPVQVQTFGTSKLDIAGGTKLQILLDKQLGLIRKLTKIDEEAQIARQSRAQAAIPMTEVAIRDAEVQFYKQQLDVVHSLERLDMDILELPKVQLDALLAKGFRLGLGEGARQGLKSPREASRRAFAESPRNNLRVIRSADIIREGQEFVNGATLTTYT